MQNSTSECHPIDEYANRNALHNYATIAVLLGIYNFMMFPFYRYVHLLNEQRDSKIISYPIMLQFYHFVRKMMISTLYFMTCLLFIYIIVITRIMGFMVTVLILVMIVLTGVANKSAVYFFPRFERAVTVSRKWTVVLLHSLHIGVAIKDIELLWRVVWGCEKEILDEDNCKLLSCAEAVVLHRIGYYVVLNVLLFTSALLYIPIIVSIRKMSHLAAAVQYRPEKYIASQTIVVVIVKAMSLLFPLLLSDFGTMMVMILLTTLDCVALPFIIQVTYLCSNKQTIDTLRTFDDFSAVFIWKKLILPIFRKPKVVPVVSTNSRSSSKLTS